VQAVIALKDRVVDFVDRRDAAHLKLPRTLWAMVSGDRHVVPFCLSSLGMGNHSRRKAHRESNVENEHPRANLYSRILLAIAAIAKRPATSRRNA
jgi:hypothetical protein